MKSKLWNHNLFQYRLEKDEDLFIPFNLYSTFKINRKDFKIENNIIYFKAKKNRWCRLYSNIFENDKINYDYSFTRDRLLWGIKSNIYICVNCDSFEMVSKNTKCILCKSKMIHILTLYLLGAICVED